MIKRSIKLEVLDNEGNKLCLNNGKYELNPFIKIMHMSNEGPTARIDRLAVNLLKDSIPFENELPQTSEYSIVINGYNEYISKNASVIIPVFTDTLATFEEGTYAKEYMLKLYGRYLKGLCGKDYSSVCDDMSEEDRIVVSRNIKRTYDKINSIVLSKNNSRKLEIK